MPEELTDVELANATRFLATVKRLDEPRFMDMVRAALVLRDSNDPEALRLAGKAIMRNLERLEDALDDAKYALDVAEEKNRHSL